MENELRRANPEDQAESKADKVRLAGAMGLEALNPEKSRGAAASELHGSHKTSEHLGRVVISAEADQRRAELSQYSETRIRSLAREELLAIAERIPVGGSDLRKIYETRLIGEGGLRRLIIKFQRGEDLMAALRSEILEHEKDFERDPAMRDLPQEAELSPSTRETISKILASSGDSDTLQTFAVKKDQPKLKPKQLLASPAIKRLSNLDKVIGLVILALAVLLVILLLKRH